jgi:outer membrane cobalamin receptor
MSFAPAFAADTLTGQVVDATGRAIPRAHVRVLDAAGKEIARLFSDQHGRFETVVADARTCQVEASLTGFQQAAVRCLPDRLTITLGLAPVQEAVLVTATRTDAPASQAGASATVFTAADIERRQNPFFADLLKLSPGAMIIRSGGTGSVTSLFVRGGESDHNKVLLDGIPLNEPGGIFFLNNLTTENLERVEIVRGAYSSLFGSDAMSSVIQLFTKRGERARRPQVTGQFDAGTYGTSHGRLSVSGAAGDIDYSLAAAQFNSDNRVPNSRLENTTLSANVGVALGSSASIRVIARGELEHAGTPGQTAFGRPDLDAFFERDDAVVGVSFDQAVTHRLRQRAAYSFAVSNQASTNLIEDPPFTPAFDDRVATFGSSDFTFDSRTNLDRHYANYQADWRLVRNPSTGAEQLLTVLADWHGERARLENRLAGSDTRPSRDNFGASIQHQMLWPRLFITVGGRVEHNESFGTEAVPRATAAFIARPSTGRIGETLLKASFGMGVKEPTILESFSLSFFSRGNPDLEPERSQSIEVGLEQRLAGDRAKVAATYFDNRFTDLIWTRTTDFTTFAGQYFNLVGLSRARGIEVSGEAAPTPLVGASAGYTFLDSKVLESSADTPVFQNGQWAFRRPRHSGFVGITARVRRVTAELTGAFTGRYVDNDFFVFDPPILEIPAHYTWDARASLRITPQLTALLMIDNLTDRDYMEPIGYQQLRRVIRAGIRIQL